VNYNKKYKIIIILCLLSRRLIGKLSVIRSRKRRTISSQQAVITKLGKRNRFTYGIQSRQKVQYLLRAISTRNRRVRTSSGHHVNVSITGRRRTIIRISGLVVHLLFIFIKEKKIF
jgi:hypothetical protein